jgi:PIN domain nuclease of toxin-antitoxin system
VAARLTHLDTHVLVWLYLGEVERFSKVARGALRDGDLAASPMALLELTYLQEVGRLRVAAEEIRSSLARQLGLRVDETPFADVIAAAHEQSWTRDPFDRLISAQAITAGASLVTADESVRAQVPGAVW